MRALRSTIDTTNPTLRCMKWAMGVMGPRRNPFMRHYALDQKMDDTLFDGLDELYHHAKFGEDRTMRAG